MIITKKVSNYNDISLDNQTQSGTISQQPTANSQQPTANSQQPTALLSKNNIQYFNNIFNETERFRIFSDRSFFYVLLVLRQECSMFTKVNIPFIHVVNSPWIRNV